jgi:hypothetical protein
MGKLEFNMKKGGLMKEITLMELKVDLVKCNGHLEIIMRDNGKIMWLVAKVYLKLMMDPFMRVSSKMINYSKANLPQPISSRSTKGSLKIIYMKEKAF